ncbi:hypothetical protein JCM17961_35050 [Endothiovibrio diazotrophicus]
MSFPEERQANREALIRANREWRTVFDKLDDALFVHDREYRVLLANRTYLEWAGLPEEQVLGEVYWHVFPRDAGPHWLCKQLVDGESTDVHDDMVLPDGKILRLSHFALPGSGAQDALFMHILEDITDHSLAQQALEQSEARFRGIAESVRDAIVMIDEEDRVLEWNPAAERLFGYSAGEALGADLRRLIVPERLRQADERPRGFESFLSTGQGPIVGSVQEVMALCKDGSELSVELSVAPVEGNSGRHCVGVARDITERRAIQRRLAEGEKRLRHIVTSLGDGVVVLDANGTALFANPAALALLGRPEEEVIGRQTGLPLAIGNGAGIEILRPGGGAVWVEAQVVESRWEEHSAYVMSLHDMSQHVQLERHRRYANQRLQEALESTIGAIALALEKRDPYTAGHQQRVSTLSVAIATTLGLEPERIEGIRLGAMIHDIGKIYIPSEILNRPGRLDPREFELIKSHPEVGYDIIKGIVFPWPVADMILQHHERLDGSGYPHGLEGEAISLEARILTVADVVEAITSHRPYRPALGIEVAIGEIDAHRGQWFQNDIVDACIALFVEQGFCF